MTSTTAGQLGGVSKEKGSSFALKLGYALLYMVLIVVAALQLFPLVWLLFFSLKSNQEVFNLPPLSLPTNPRWENYSKVWSAGNIDTYFLNSVWITVVATALTVTYVAFNMPITIMILLGFYYALPREVEEAAVIDGCSVNRMFFRIVLPMTGSVIATTSIINMIYNWNEFIFVNTFISSDSYKTLTVGVQNFIGQYTTDWGAIGATLMISILPILIAFLFLSDRIVEGMAAGSVKG
ncbi:carbohydrate ABC transporter permease [Paenibacillus sp. MCAF20]